MLNKLDFLEKGEFNKLFLANINGLFFILIIFILNGGDSEIKSSRQISISLLNDLLNGDR